MATLTAALLQGIEKNTPRSKRKLQKHLRSSGLAYISRTGKLIPAKKVADELCTCPQKCDERVPVELRERLFTHFYGLCDTDKQNAFLRKHMDVRARMNLPEMTVSGRSPRRITCKYLVPVLPSVKTVDVCQKAFVSAFVITTKRVRLQREKLISSMGLNSYGHHRGAAIKPAASPQTSENLDEAETSSSQDVGMLPSQCELIATAEGSSNKTSGRGGRKRVVDDPLIPFGLVVPEGVTIAPVTATPDHDRDIAIVNNFFSNQLWKPEYILGTYS
ncbi:PREDICTED: uncharacterized protein LOC108563599 [Nicrophorus vespilloides]|uniref:Uncharacterized protein LOC108563599 n=1 Tax=Nicrophorus vespilloides TaxID=110193 RepID=A0ABM1MTB4_NICVS|nr:PREDICTED: uncharacterized protein LOC108563599 [Nicrophorus vespilloides]